MSALTAAAAVAVHSWHYVRTLPLPHQRPPIPIPGGTFALFCERRSSSENSPRSLSRNSSRILYRCSPRSLLRISSRSLSMRKTYPVGDVRAFSSSSASKSAPAPSYGPSDSSAQRLQKEFLLQSSTTATNADEQQTWSLTSPLPVVLPPKAPAGDSDSHEDRIRRRVTLARLVKGVYELEFRRSVGVPFEKDPPARSWWESVRFDLEEGGGKLDHPDKAIDLVVYTTNPSADPVRNGEFAPVPTRPRVVIAIRGTLPNVDDGWHNLNGSLQRLHLTPRYKRILQIVRQAVEKHGIDQVCLTGHSLGASLGLLVGRTLATEDGIGIECHLFNPVYAYSWFPAPAQLSGPERDGLWKSVRVARCAAVAGLANVLIDESSRTKIATEFKLLEDWMPHLYINTGDPICRGYWEYFTNHERLARSGLCAAYVANLAAPFSGRGLLTTALGSKPLHLLPSAVLHVCEGDPPSWPGDDINYRQRYASHVLGSWMLEDLPVQTRSVRLSSW